jgi:hypothetical protein
VPLTYLLANHVVLLALGMHLGWDFEAIPGPIPEQVIGLISEQAGYLRR